MLLKESCGLFRD